MRYTVVWVPEAERELTSIWLNSSNRERISAAADEIDRVLPDDPETQGESREDGFRILLVPPLAVIYRVVAVDRIVQILDIWEFKIKR